MIDIGKLWGVTRRIRINRKRFTVPFAIKLSSLGIPLDRWLKSEGKPSVVSRMKALKVWALQIISGERTFVSPWIKHYVYRGYCIPRFPLFRWIVDAFISQQLDKIKIYLTILNSYKLYRPTIGSLDSIITPPKIKVDPVNVELFLKYVDLPQVPPACLEVEDAVLTNTVHALNMGETMRGPMGRPDLYEECNPFMCGEMADSLGRLTVVPDKGKPRTILIGHWHHQLQTKRLADYLRKYLWSRFEIASGDQNKMVDFIKTNSHTSYMVSLDQSQATDRLSVDFQIQLLMHMGVPKGYFYFLTLPFFYKPKDFGLEGTGMKQGYYSNGQPMGIYLSFPMFELAHYVIAKFSVASTNSTFCICGDDIIFASNSKEEATEVTRRYVDVIESLGGKIEPSKSFHSPVAEGVGRIFYAQKGGNLIDITPPTGSISPREAEIDTYLKSIIDRRTPIGRAILYSWISPAERHSYTYQDRRRFWSWFLKTNFYLEKESYNILFKEMERMPQEWNWDTEPPAFLRQLERPELKSQLKFVTESTLRSALLTTKIKSLYLKERK